VAGIPRQACEQALTDVDCDADSDAVDALLILRFVAGLPPALAADCPALPV
jgi:hypothetical protein